MKNFLKIWGYCIFALGFILLLTATSVGAIGCFVLFIYYIGHLMFVKAFLSIIGILILGSFSFACIAELTDSEYKGE